MAKPKSGTSLWPALTAREWWRLALAAVVVAALMAVTTRYDELWVLYLARFREPGWVIHLNSTMLEGGPPGMSDVVLFAYLAAIAAYALSFLPGMPALFRHWRARTGYLLAVSLGTGITVHALKLIVARARPWEVLGGDFAFTPWYVGGALPALENGRTGSFPSGHTATAAVLCAFAFVLPRWVGQETRRAVVLISVTLAVLTGFARVFAQSHWPTDVVAGAVVGYAATWLLYRLRLPGAEADPPPVSTPFPAPSTAEPPQQELPWANHPAGRGTWALRITAAYIGVAVAAVGAVVLIRQGNGPGAWLGAVACLSAVLALGALLLRWMRSPP